MGYTKREEATDVFFLLRLNVLVHKKLLVLYFQQHESRKQRHKFAITAFPLGRCRAKTQTLSMFSSMKKVAEELEMEI